MNTSYERENNLREVQNEMLHIVKNASKMTFAEFQNKMHLMMDAYDNYYYEKKC